MILISHRGNISGRNPDLENNPFYIMNAVRSNFDVEVDVWLVDGKFFLGHDSPEHEVEWRFLKNSYLWCHAKNKEALSAMLTLGIHCFWHQNDDYTLTSKGYVWTYPGKETAKQSIIVCNEFNKDLIGACTGICSDNISSYLDEMKNRGIAW